jgi:DNA-binding response OmpR family regulator
MQMNTVESLEKIFVVDTNLFFVKRLTEALKQKGFEAVHCSDPAYALTMIEWNMPVAILCSTASRGPNTFEIPAILQGDAKTSHIPVIAIGDRGQQSQLEALRAGYEDFVDRRLGAEEIAAHLVSLLSSHKDGFQSTQMLPRAETALDGRLSLVDLPGVIQMIEQSRQTGALHVNVGTTDGIIFFNTGEVIHAESGLLAGDDAIVCLIKTCQRNKDGVYKFIPGSAPTLRTVHCNLSGLIMDALREIDEEDRDNAVALEEVEPEPAATEQEEDVCPEPEATTQVENVEPQSEQEATVEDVKPELESTPLVEVEPEPESEIVSEELPVPDAPPSRPRLIDMDDPTTDIETCDPEPQSEPVSASNMCMFDTATVDDALFALDEHLVDVIADQEETHE